MIDIRYCLLAFFILIPANVILAQENTDQTPESSLLGWGSVEVNHDFTKAKLYLTGFIQYESIGFEKTEDVYGRFSFGVKPLKWLSFGVNYVPLYDNLSTGWKHYFEGDVVGTLRSGNFKVSLRERYRHGFTTDSNELRSRLKVAYAVPKTNFTPYMAIEVFTWGTEWKRTRHYVGCTYNFTKSIQLDWYYMYYTFQGKPEKHVLGLSLNFNI